MTLCNYFATPISNPLCQEGFRYYRSLRKRDNVSYIMIARLDGMCSDMIYDIYRNLKCAKNGVNTQSFLIPDYMYVYIWQKQCTSRYVKSRNLIGNLIMIMWNLTQRQVNN